MLSDAYQEYLYLIGKLKDTYKFDVDAEHRHIHAFYLDKKPLFKLFYGIFSNENTNSIVVSYHMDMKHHEVIDYFIKIYRICPIIAVQHAYIEDDLGETYLGEDAEVIKNAKITQEVLENWLGKSSEEDMQKYVDAKVMGRDRDPKRMFDASVEKEKAQIEFDRIRKPFSDDEIQ